MTTDANPRAVPGNNSPPDLATILAQNYADLKKRTDNWVTRAKKANLSPKTLEECAVLDKLVADAQALIKEATDAQKKEKEEPAKMVKAIDGFFLTAGIVGTIDKTKEPINKASAKTKVEIADAERERLRKEAAKAAADAEAIALKADAAAERGDVRQADVFERQAEVKFEASQSAAVAASQSTAQATRQEVGGIRSSANVKMICTGVDRSKIDLEKLRMFIKPEALVDAVNAALKIDPDFRLEHASLERDYNQRVARK